MLHLANVALHVSSQGKLTRNMQQKIGKGNSADYRKNMVEKHPIKALK